MIVPVNLQRSISPDEMEELTLKEIQVNEAKLEEFVRQNVGVLFPESEETLLIVGQQARNVQRGRADLVAVDGSGNLVLIEVKRDVDDIAARREPFEFQAIRYAASCACIKTPQDLVQKLFASYIDRHRNEYELKELTPSELATRKLNEFLRNNQAERTFNRSQRIILIASAFDDQTLSACAWLAKNGIDIRCLRLTPLRYNHQHFLEIEQLIPPRPLDDYFVEIADPSMPGARGAAEPRSRSRDRLARMPELFEWGLIKPGDGIYIAGHEDNAAEVIDGKYVRYNGEKMSYHAWGRKVTGWSSVNVYVSAVHRESGKTLDTLRQEGTERTTARAGASTEGATPAR